MEQELTFEQAFQQLEQVVQQLENGGLSLDQSILLFEQGMRLAGFCEAKLNEADQRVSQLVGNGVNNVIMTPFAVEE